MLAALLAGLILMGLAGCAANTNTESNPQEVSTAKVSSPAKENGESSAVTTPAGSTASPVEAAESTAEQETPKQTDTPAAESGAPSEISIPAQTEPPKQTQTPEAPPPTQQQESSAEPTEPAPQPTEPAETEPPHTEPPEPEFDINYWISYAQNYAVSIGLKLESSAVSCWDNPIIANARCIYLERDIKGTLDWYKKDETITDVWIWAELRSDGSYDLYIGYA